MRTLAPVLAWLLATVGAAGAAPTAHGATVSRGDNPAVLALLDAAEQELNAERPDQASMLLERALRIEPQNPAVWHYLGLARLGQREYAQAEAMAAKSQNLAAHDRALHSRNARLAAAAAQASGRPVAPQNEESALVALSGSLEAELERASTYVDTWQRGNDAYAEQVRRQRAARQGRIEPQPEPKTRASQQPRPGASTKKRVQIQI